MWRSGGGESGGRVVAVAVEEVEFWKSGESEVVVVVVEGRNWKSARRRSAHLLAEKLVGTLLAPPVTLLAPPVTALSRGGFLSAAGS